MSSVSLAWSRFVRLFRHASVSHHQPSKDPRRGLRTRRNRFERLESREVFSVEFSSGLNIGGEGGDAVWDIATDSSGNSYVTGYFAGTVDFDPRHELLNDADVLTALGENDGFVAKYAPDDSLVWVHRMGGNHLSPNAITDCGRDIAVDIYGNVYVAGEFYGAAKFGNTTLISEGTSDPFVAKFDATGTLAWVTPMPSENSSKGVDVDSQGNVYAMMLRDTTTYDVIKLASSGAVTWSKPFVTNNSLTAGDLAVGANGNVYVVGSFSQTVDFDPGPKVKSVAVGNKNATFVLKLDTNGNFGWVTPFFGSGQAYAYTVTVDGAGNTIVGGNYTGIIDFDPSRSTRTLDPAGGGYIAKLNTTGGLVWANAMVGGAVNAVAADASNNVFATGSFLTAIDLDPGTPVRSRASAGSYDIFVVQLNSSGSYSWGETMGGASNDQGCGIAVDAMGSIHVAGWFADAVDFDPNPNDSFTLGAPGARRSGFKIRFQRV